MANKESILDGLDAGVDLGVIATMLLSFLGLGKTGFAQKIGGFFTSFGKTPAVKQKFGKWFGIGLEDEGELWKAVLALLRQRNPHGMQKVIAIGQLLAAMKDDSERNMFRAIIIKVSSGTTVRQRDVTAPDGKKSQMVSSASKLDTTDDLRVIALETLALLILGDKPDEAFKMTLDMGNGRHVICPTVEEDIRIELALDIIRNQGLGKDSEPMRIARKAWRAFTEHYLASLLAEISSFLTTRSDKLEAGYPKKDHPSIVIWVIEKVLPGAYKTPIMHTWEINFVVGIYHAIRARSSSVRRNP